MTETNSKPEVLLAIGSTKAGVAIGKLLEQGFSVSDVSDAESAWNMIVETPHVAVLICELSLLVGRFGLLERLRGACEERIAAIPVLLLVGEGDDDEAREAALRGGATDFINLPFVRSELLTRVSLQAGLFNQSGNSSSGEAQPLTSTTDMHHLVQENTFNSLLRQELSFSERHKTYFSVCKLKLDNLKAITADFDKKTAAAAAQVVTGMLQQAARCEDTLCSLGWAEYYILYPATNGIGAAVAINRVLQKISARQIKVTDKQVPVSISVAIFTDIANQESSVDVVLDILQSRLDEAVAKGGNCVISAGRTNEKAPVSVDRALKLIAEQHAEAVEPQVKTLMMSILPLLEYADDALELGLRSVNQELCEKIK
ncbi:MAG: diguanylate cyclase [Gammaproteobacteria bacterium]|nr:diguanylate cyclase [Gammaproteobacteria bacterium]